MSRQALRLTLEDPTAPGVFDADATQKTLLRVTEPFTDFPKPIQWIIRDAASSNRRVQIGSEQTETTIRVRSIVFYDQAKLILPAFCTPVATNPFLQTFTIDYFDSLDDGTKAYTRHLGMTPQNLTLQATNSGNGVLMMMDMTFMGRDWSHALTATEFPEPALSDYDYSHPAVFQDLKGNVTIGSAVTGFKDFSLSIKNTLDPLYDENQNPTPTFYGARDVDWAMSFRYKSASYRADYEATAAKAVQFAMTDGTTTLTFNLHAANYYTDLARERPFDRAFYDKISGGAFLDVAAGDDLTLTVAP